MTINATHFDPLPENVRAARRFVQSAVGDDYDPTQLAALTSELVTVLNLDNDETRRLHAELNLPGALTYSLTDTNADFSISDLMTQPDGQTFYLFVQEVSCKVHVEVQYREPACPGRETTTRIANRLRVLRALANRSGIHVASGEITEWFEVGRDGLAPAGGTDFHR